jgi:hypothetical protein
MTMVGKQAGISVYVEPELKDALRALASTEGRSVADTIRRILREHVRRRQEVQ